MEVVILNDSDRVAEMAADAVTDLLAQRPDAVLGLARGPVRWVCTASWRGDTPRAP